MECAPRLEHRAARQLQVFEEPPPEQGRRGLQPLGVEGAHIAGCHVGDAEQIDVETGGVEKHAVPIGPEAALVDDVPELREAPAQRSAWIVRNIPEHLAQMIAPLAPVCHREIGEQGAGLFRRRQRDFPGVPQDHQLAEHLDLNWALHLGHRSPAPVLSAMPRGVNLSNGRRCCGVGGVAGGLISGTVWRGGGGLAPGCGERDAWWGG